MEKNHVSEMRREQKLFSSCNDTSALTEFGGLSYRDSMKPRSFKRVLAPAPVLQQCNQWGMCSDVADVQQFACVRRGVQKLVVLSIEFTRFSGGTRG